MIGRRAIPLCSFVVAYLWRHPEQRDLVVDDPCERAMTELLPRRGLAMKRSARIAVVYYRATDNVRRLAHALAEGAAMPLPERPLKKWEQTRETLHLWVQIVGKLADEATALSLQESAPPATRRAPASALTQFLVLGAARRGAKHPPLESTVSQAVSFGGGVG